MWVAIVSGTGNVRTIISGATCLGLKPGNAFAGLT
jgi:hypothetical protein